jgi:hypothetical protein
VSNEIEAQLDRLEYILSHGAKEGLVERPQDWPGAHALTALLTGDPLEGYWFDRTQEYAARRRGQDFDRLQYATAETLVLDPLPCWGDLPEDQYRERIGSLLAQIEFKSSAERQRKGTEPLGRAAIPTSTLATKLTNPQGCRPLLLVYTLSTPAMA